MTLALYVDMILAKQAEAQINLTPPPPEKSQKYRVSQQYWSGSPENHKATKPTFNFGPLSAHQRKAI